MKQFPKYTILLYAAVFLANLSFGQENSQAYRNLERYAKKAWGTGKSEIQLLESFQELPSNGLIYAISQNNSLIGYAYTGRVFSCREGGCSATAGDAGSDSYEYFDYLILYNIKASIELVRVFNYQATHGQQICNPAWLNQFKNYNGSSVLHYGSDIDAISGATISAISIISDIEKISAIVNKSLAEEFEKTSRIN
ncbi:MAG: FMN-binding protein [Bacteroidota bacterium]|nr:MAG: FMN-binding protein [Bacteroidota bacterium]